MNQIDTALAFANSFRQASNNISASVYSSSIRFIAISLVILGVMWSINHFMSSEEKEQDGFLVRLGSRLIRLVIGLIAFILLIFVRG